MVSNIELCILKILASRTDVNWTWYNLDRAMTKRKMEGVGNVARLVRNLSEAGLVHRLDLDAAGSHACNTGFPGFSNVANIETNLMRDALVVAVYNDDPSKPRERMKIIKEFGCGEQEAAMSVAERYFVSN